MSESLTSNRIEAVAFSNESTVIAEFLPDEGRETAHQSESEMERTFIKQLQQQAYDYLPITTETELIANLRGQLESLNKITFSESEWERFFDKSIAKANDGIVEKTARIQEDYVQGLTRDDGSIRSIHLIDKERIHNNSLQVINQYEAKGEERANRYDVTILVNGLPMVHVELKRRGVNFRDAFNQINRYQRESFWAGSGLFEYVQLFVISNGTLSKYYSNTVRDGHLSEKTSERRKKSKTSNSFSFTNWWADAANRNISDLRDFTRTFFAKHTLLSILTRYCVFDVQRKLLVMRPYQIAATEQILQRIATATHNKLLGTRDAGGYVWHTTGSGKTLTRLDYRFFFYPWYEDPAYTIPQDEAKDVIIPRRLIDYFIALRKKESIALTKGQMIWYALKEKTLGAQMKQEYPTTPAEAFCQSLEGAYYREQFDDIYNQKRICPVPHNPGALVHTIWDLGVNDANSIWFVQRDGRGWNVIHYYENDDVGVGHYARKLAEFKSEYGYQYGVHIGPHDLAVREWGNDAQTRWDSARAQGITFTYAPNIPRIDGIEATRKVLPLCRFDEEKTAEGVAHLQAYRKEWDDKRGMWKDTPYHGPESNAADSFRYFAVSLDPILEQISEVSKHPMQQKPSPGAWGA